MPIGPETQVNTYTTGFQAAPQITALSDGGWVIIWEAIGQDGSSYGTYAQAYTADGTPQGSETQVNTYTTSSQSDPQIAALNDGGWVITWESYEQDGDSYGIYAQAYNADGTAQGSETQVNTYTTDVQEYPQITALIDGGWVITWESNAQDGSSDGIYAQAYTADGTALGSETQVNTYTTSSQSDPQITALNDGGWVITWQSVAQDGDSYGIYAQAYNADGTAQGSETQVNTYTTDVQADPQITALNDGGWVITWTSDGQDGDSYGIYAQAYNADGTAQGSETQVNTYTTNVQVAAQITALNDGGWVVTWSSLAQDGDNYGIYAQAYNADGTARGSETQVNTYTTNAQAASQITALSDGGWVITWSSSAQDGDSYGIYAQAYNADGTALGSEAQVNTYTTGVQSDPQITALNDGGWVITWESSAQDGDNYGVYSKIFRQLNADDISVTLTGTQEVGETLTAAFEGFDINDPTVNVVYTWSVGSTVVATTFEPTFTLLAEHANQEVSVSVTLQDLFFIGGLVTEGAVSDPIFDGNDAPVGDVIFEVSDALDAPLGDQDALESIEIGYTFDIDEFIIQDLDGTEEAAYQFQWLRSGEVIDGETGLGYTITAQDEGHKIKLAISYTDGNGFENTFLSEALKVAGITGAIVDGASEADALLGSAGNDLISGFAGADVLSGFKGADILKGGSGADTLIGNRGADNLKGGNGQDTLFGGAGGDRLEGGKGDDIITGGNGADKFVFKGDFGHDVVTDFNSEEDTLVSEIPFFAASSIYQEDGNMVFAFNGGFPIGPVPMGPEALEPLEATASSITFLDTDISDFYDYLPI